MKRLAFTTFAIMHAPYGSAEVSGFEKLTPSVFQAAENAPGFIDRARETDGKTETSNFERDWGVWGSFRTPRFYDGGFTFKTDTRASTLSLWTTIESVLAFVDSGLHMTALQQRHKWFRKPDWPSYAMWWLDDEIVPTWSQAVEALERLHAKGPCPAAFNFKNPFAPSGLALPPYTRGTVQDRPALVAEDSGSLKRAMHAAILHINPTAQIHDDAALIDLGVDSLGLIRLLIGLEKTQDLDLDILSAAQPPRTVRGLLQSLAMASRSRERVA